MTVSSDEICKVRTAKNNITKHLYEVGDYKLCKAEAEIVGRALKLYLQQLERMDKSFHETTVWNTGQLHHAKGCHFWELL